MFLFFVIIFLILIGIQKVKTCTDVSSKLTFIANKSKYNYYLKITGIIIIIICYVINVIAETIKIFLMGCSK